MLTVDAIFGPSQAMRTLLEQVTRAAASSGHILISGEPGTGREMVAREIHRRSTQPGGWFVKVADTSKSPEALEFDLFGFHSSSPGERHLDQVLYRGQLLYRGQQVIESVESVREILTPEDDK